MEDQYKKLFSNIQEEYPSHELYTRVVSRIRNAEKSKARRRVFFLGFISILSAIALIPAWNELQGELQQSGFFEFVSLAFSDFSLVAQYWKDFAFSLLESLPAVGLAATLAALLVFLSSIRLVLKSFLILRMPTRMQSTN